MSLKKILIAEDQEEIRELLVILLEGEFDNPLLEACDGKEAIDFLKNDSEIGLILSDYNMPNANGGEVYTYNQKNNNIPFFLLSTECPEDHEEMINFQKDNSNNCHFEKPYKHTDLSNTILDTLSTNAKESFHSDTHYRVKIERIIKMNSYFSSAYLKISDEKFVKISNSGDPIETAKLDSYRQKGEEFIYFRRDEADNQIKEKMNLLKTKLTKTHDSITDLAHVQLKSIEEVQNVVKSIGVKEEVIELTDHLTKSVLSGIKREKNMKNFFGRIIQHSDYKFELSNLINYLVCAIVKELNYDFDRTCKKLTTAAMFCDIVLDSPKLAKVININNEYFRDLKLNERNNVKDHMHEASKVLENSSQFSLEEIEIIQNHHEKPDGSGFPKGLTAEQIKPLCAIFILAHDFAREILLSGKKDNIDLREILNRLGDSYSLGNFKAPYQSLLKAIESELK